MDILNLWNDDPEEVLLDLGFGCDEPDLSGRIPARFINHQSQAKGINLQVFLEAQKDRLDLENPDVSNRFKQLEVLQHVTTAFSSLMGSSCSPVGTSQGKELPPEDQEKRRRIGMLFRRASKKSLSRIHKNKTQDPLTPSSTSPTCASPESLQLPPTHGEKRVSLGLQEKVCLCPLAEEQGAGPDPQSQPLVASLAAQECTPQPRPLRGGHPVTAKTSSQRKKSVSQISSIETEINSFEENSVTGSYMGAVNNLEMPSVMRIDSYQSDSSSFPEELSNPSLSQASPGPDLIKALSSRSGGSNDSKSHNRPGSPLFHTYPSFLLSSSLTSPDDKSVLSSPCPSPGHSLVLEPHLCPVSLCLPKSDPQLSEMEKPPDQSQFQPASLLTLVCKYISELQIITKFQSPVLVPHVLSSEDNDALSPNLCTLSNDSEGTACLPSSPLPATSLSPSPNCDHSALDVTSSAQSNLSPGNTRSGWPEVASHEYAISASSRLSPYTTPGFHHPSSSPSPPLFQSLSRNTENNKKDSVITICLSDPATNTWKKEDKGNPLFPSCHSKFKRKRTALPCLSHNASNPICQSDLSSQSQDPHDLIDSAVERISDLTEQSISQQNRSCPLDDCRDPAPESPVPDNIHVKMDHLSLESNDTLQMNRKGLWMALKVKMEI
ncbi:protein ITPRID1 [Acanthopagrus latus]|uniref:protein ITPRID1 n=1 Tax=Acanthopagrus latus TaxID=8177 RepID=UPI00187BF0E8|nr:protein ITPRID1 [Acanthopagrus latus]